MYEPRAIAVTVNGERVHTAYAPNGRKVGTHPHQIKLAWFMLYTVWLKTERADFDRLLVAADLNITPLGGWCQTHAARLDEHSSPLASNPKG